MPSTAPSKPVEQCLTERSAYYAERATAERAVAAAQVQIDRTNAWLRQHCNHQWASQSTDGLHMDRFAICSVCELYK